MDGLSAAASGIAVVQIAVSLANSFIELHDFWVTIQGAPDYIRDLARDLEYLSSLLNEISNEQHHGDGTRIAMQCCETKINVLLNIVREFEPSFSSDLHRVRFWNKLKVARKDKNIKKFRDALAEAKITLLLALRPRCHLPPAYVASPGEGTRRSPASHVELQKTPTFNRSVSDPGMLGGETIKSQCHYGVKLPKTPALTRSISDSETSPPPSYSEKTAMAFNLADTQNNETILKPEHHYLSSSIVPIPDIQGSIRASIESALVSKPASFFDGSLFAKAINETIQSRHSNRATSTASCTTVPYDLGHPASMRQQVDLLKGHHTILATETLFGTVWLRTSTVRAGGRSKSSKGSYAVKSVVYYPSWWLTKFGLKHGMEASFSSSANEWQICLSPVRAVPESSLIFDFCKMGNIAGVQRLIARGDASVRDASPKGWTPLHFAAEAANVELCSYLISEGAEKGALAYEGPSADTLSAVTIFAQKAQSLSAQHKIAMLRLFLDTVNFSEPGDDGWTIIGQLIRSQRKENASIASKSVMWLLQQFSTDNLIAFGPRSLWHALHHALRSFLYIISEDAALRKLENLGPDRMKGAIGSSHACSIARWVALRVTGKHCYPMLMVAASILHVEGYDWIGEGPEPNRPLVEKQLPFLFSKWTETLTYCFERAEELMALELEATFEQAAWAQDNLHDDNSRAPDSDQRQRCSDMKHCATCGDDYTYLGAGLVEPRWIAFAECTKSEHRFNCSCSQFPRSYESGKTTAIQQSAQELDQRDQPDKSADIGPLSQENTNIGQQGLRGTFESYPNNRGTSSLGLCKDTSDEENETTNSQFDVFPDDESNDAESFYDLDYWLEKDKELIVDALKSDESDPFKAVAHHLHCAQGRTWVGSYKPGELVCGSCFLRREGYINEPGKDDDEDIFSSMPSAFRGKAAEE